MLVKVHVSPSDMLLYHIFCISSAVKFSVWSWLFWTVTFFVLCYFYSDSMKPGGWWTSCGRVSWLITMPVLGWQSPPRYIPANPLICQLSGVCRRLNWSEATTVVPSVRFLACFQEWPGCAEPSSHPPLPGIAIPFFISAQPGLRDSFSGPVRVWVPLTARRRSREGRRGIVERRWK